MQTNPDDIFDDSLEPVDGVRAIPYLPDTDPNAAPDASVGRHPYGPDEPVQTRALEVHYERKFNLGNFESLQVGVAIWARSRIADGERFDLHDVKRRLRDMARTNVRAQLLRFKGDAAPVFLGLQPPTNDGFDPIYIRTVGVSLSQKVNLGNYENIAPAYSDWADVRALSGSQAALHIAMERLWASLWANIADELSRAQGRGSLPEAFFGLPPLEIEDLTAGVSPVGVSPAGVSVAAAAPNGAYANGHGPNGHNGSASYRNGRGG
jgi:hypothetical protein